ncbi:hypothetical protein Rsub_09039 [Raphidocelis subcapitata]|uniref:F-box domain-containing protein n=1 Tax=Raphidocelis subcapitata TaxID=307507 RepID=A0A2V0PBP7_9CHLO|nr:hypothetical protein Rsub_09039 [Raphidocelis subcapitata]|eukprot:GBF96959.1 hypothetical protein Rsub_09039 [Raphidocelis subcapitata]
MAATHHVPEEVLARVAQRLSLRDRCRAACASRAWRAAAAVDAPALLGDDGAAAAAQGELRHLSLSSGDAQWAAARAPSVRLLARSAELSVRPSTSALLPRLKSLRRLALTGSKPASFLDFVPPPRTVVSLSLALLERGSGRGSSSGGGRSARGSGSGGGSCGGRRGRRSGSGSGSGSARPRAGWRRARRSEAGTAAPSRPRPRGLSIAVESAWDQPALGEVCRRLADGAPQLRALELRCASSALFAESGAALAPLGALTSLSKVVLGPAPEGPARGAPPSPLGFARPPAFLARLPALAEAELALADSAESPIELADFAPLARLPEVALALRADTGPSGIACALPPGLAAVTGLTRLSVHAFSFEDVGGWRNAAAFDASPLAALPSLRELSLALRNWGCEAADVLLLRGLEGLTRLRTLGVAVSVPPPPGAAAAAGDGLKEVRLALPDGLACVSLSASCRLAVRNSRALARAGGAAVLARGIVFEEASAAGEQAAWEGREPQAVARGGAAEVVAALPELFAGLEAWREQLLAPLPRCERRWWAASERALGAELLCRSGGRGAALESLGAVLCEGVAARWRWGPGALAAAGL